jgi:FkbM family methyltransferase
MQLSYAQCLEDFHLDLVVGDRRSGFYVDVGGGHPVADNVSFHFYLKGWRGIVVEPQENLARLYASLRPRDIVLDHLVGRSEGEVAFHKVDRLHGFSTIVEANAIGAGNFGARYVTEQKRIRPLHAVLDDVGAPKVDFLKIDVEGAEADVLEGMDWTRHRPSVLCIEAIQPGSGGEAFAHWEPILTGVGYRFAFFDGINRFYVPGEESALLDRFPKSPTPWNSVTHFYELGRPHKQEDHPDRALAERLIKGFLAGAASLPENEIFDLLARSAGTAGLEQGEKLRRLLVGTADFPGHEASNAKDDPRFDDRVRAALGRISAQYDGGVVTES